ncbi:hypothetical protein WR25_12345 [Diploscapter pachys]|uniref:RNA helicase n=1 Tax=Diploscapter pachys TaxID=2018661 RepID=A0A2A2LB94_9BILA|nr:hypothetical protein WR25_12345 [Diploscapter pachys]
MIFRMVMNCPLCSFMDASYEVVETHILEDHLDFRPWECMECNARRSTKRMLDGHIQGAHNQNTIKVLYVSDLKKENEHRRLMQLVFDCGRGKSESVADPVTSARSITPFSEAPPTPNQALFDVKQEFPSTVEHSASLSLEESKMMFEASTSQMNDNDFQNHSDIPEVGDEKGGILKISNYNDGQNNGVFDTVNASLNGSIKNATSLNGLNVNGVMYDDWMLAAQSKISSIRRQCQRCKEWVNDYQSTKIDHVYNHMCTDDNVCAYRCSFPTCTYGHTKKGCILFHVKRDHDKAGFVNYEPICCIEEQEFKDKSREVFNDCFLESAPVRMSDMQWNMTVKPKFKLKCGTCRWMYMGNSSRQVLAHVASHMFKLYKEPMFVCGLCKFGNANRSVVARHIKSVHEDKADVVNNTRNWDVENVKKVCELCFGSADHMHTIMTRTWLYEKRSLKGMKKRSDEVEIGDDQPSTSRESASEEWNDDDEDEDPSYELFSVEDKNEYTRRLRLSLMRGLWDFLRGTREQKSNHSAKMVVPGVRFVSKVMPSPLPSTICPACSLNEETTEALEEHVMLDHLEWAPYKCTICNVNRVSKKKLADHAWANHRNSNPSIMFVSDPDKEEELRQILGKVGIKPDLPVPYRPPTTSNENKKALPRIQCNMCDKYMYPSDNEKKRHALSHLHQDEGLAIFKCPVCTFRHYLRNTINAHIGKYHKGSAYVAIEVNSPEIESKIDACTKQCFDGMQVELRSLEEWRDIANGCVPRDSNEPERRSEVVINRPNDITFCNICKQHFQSGYNEMVIRHVAFHMFAHFKNPLYICTLCSFKAADCFTIRNHTKKAHCKTTCYKDNLMHWDLKQVLAISVMCFDEEHFLLNRMPPKFFVFKNTQITSASNRVSHSTSPCSFSSNFNPSAQFDDQEPRTSRTSTEERELSNREIRMDVEILDENDAEEINMDEEQAEEMGKKSKETKTVEESIEEEKNEEMMQKKEKKKRKSVTFKVDEKKEEVAVQEKPKKKKLIIEKSDAKAPESTEANSDKKKKRKRTKHNKSAKRRKMMDEVMAPSVEKANFEATEEKTFDNFDLDERIIKTVNSLGWSRPTQVQEAVIGLLMEDKNVMARARTGSGKTAAFLLPILHKVLSLVTEQNQDSVLPLALFIAPTKELGTQIFKFLQKFMENLPFLQVLSMFEQVSGEQETWKDDTAHLVVSTPGRLLEMLKYRPDFCSSLRHLVLDEADLLLSYGYEKEMSEVRDHLPSVYQCIMTSATLSDDMSYLKKIFMTGSVVTIKLKEGDLPNADQLSQYQISCADDAQKFAILVAMFKLKLIVGKSIIFVNTVNRSYQLSLVLRSFGIRSCILNAAMPANSRCHVIDKFNSGLFSIVIASDDKNVDGVNNQEEEKEKKTKHSKERQKLDREAGVSRGIDFHHVGNVVNFDFPLTSENYVHRVGRTARGWNKGTALSFCTPEEKPLFDKIEAEVNEMMGSQVLVPYEMKIKELDTFVLRTREALSKCSKKVIKAARLKEIKEELLRSTKLQSFFASNPREKSLMATDSQPVTLRVQSSALADVPDYMVPKALRGMDFSTQTHRKSKKSSKNRNKLRFATNHKKFKKKTADPLRSFKV